MDERADQVGPVEGDVIELLGLAAMAQLWMVEASADATRHAADLDDRVRLVELMDVHSRRFAALREALGDRLVPAMSPCRAAVDAFAEHTRPSTFAEAVVRLELCQALAADFWRATRENIPDSARRVLETGAASDVDDWVAGRLTRTLEEDPDQHGRAALMGRRLLGEATSQAQSVWARNPRLTALVTGASGDADEDLEVISTLMATLASGHDDRMVELGLA